MCCFRWRSGGETGSRVTSVFKPSGVARERKRKVRKKTVSQWVEIDISLAIELIFGLTHTRRKLFSLIPSLIFVNVSPSRRRVNRSPGDHIILMTLIFQPISFTHRDHQSYLFQKVHNSEPRHFEPSLIKVFYFWFLHIRSSLSISSCVTIYLEDSTFRYLYCWLFIIHAARICCGFRNPRSSSNEWCSCPCMSRFVGHVVCYASRALGVVYYRHHLSSRSATTLMVSWSCEFLLLS